MAEIHAIFLALKHRYMVRDLAPLPLQLKNHVAKMYVCLLLSAISNIQSRQLRVHVLLRRSGFKTRDGGICSALLLFC
jgi:hypothetical protein